MNRDFTENSALPTVQGFYYQILVGLLMCFDLTEGQSIFFEMDGDVSLAGSTAKAVQVEVKHYSDKLTDNHINFWRTLTNWASQTFDHRKYKQLVLLTTQEFGVRTRLKSWNESDANQRLRILEKISCENKSKKSEVKNLQGKILSMEKTELMTILGKMQIIEKSDDINEVKNKIGHKLVGIPKINTDAYIRALIGHIFIESESHYWEVSYESFREWTEYLTGRYGLHKFPMPTFEGDQASNEDVEKYQDQLFVKKILDIQLNKVIPEAIGNWLEVMNSLSSFEGHLVYREKTNKYKKHQVSHFRKEYELAKLSETNSSNLLRASQKFYYQTTTSHPISVDELSDVSQVYRNGILHEAMNDKELDIKWSLDG